MLNKIIENKIENIMTYIDSDMFVYEQNDPLHDYILSKNCYEWYYTIAKTLQPKSILEIGVRFGYSLVSMMKGAEDSVQTVVGIDNDSYIWNSAQVARKYCETVKPNITTIDVIDSQQLQTLDRQFDLVHIDGDHTYIGKVHDLNLVKTHCKYCIIDDYDFIETVRKATDDFINDNSSIIKNKLYIPSFRGTMILEFI